MTARLKIAIAKLADSERPDDLAKVGRLNTLLTRASAWARPVMPVKGADLLATGIAAGPEIGQRLSRLEDAWIASGFRLSREDLLATLP